MTRTQIRLIEESLAKVIANARTITDVFYELLFQSAPDVRSMFPDDMAAQKMKLLQMLGSATLDTDRGHVVLPDLYGLARRHAVYGVRPEHYDIVGGVLLASLEKVLGPVFTAEVRDAWAQAYTALADEMKKIAEA